MYSSSDIKAYRDQGLRDTEIMKIVGKSESDLYNRFDTRVLKDPSMQDWEKEQSAGMILDRKYGGSASKPVSKADRVSTQLLKPTFSQNHPILSGIGGAIDAGVKGLANTVYNPFILPFEYAANDLGLAPKGMQKDLQQRSQDFVTTAPATIGAATAPLTGGLGLAASSAITGGVTALAASARNTAKDVSTDTPLSLSSSVGEPLVEGAITGGTQYVGGKIVQGLSKLGDTEAKVQKAVMPQTTAKVMQESDPNLVTDKTLFKAPKVAPTGGQKELAEVGMTLKDKGFAQTSSPFKNKAVVQNALRDESNTMLRAIEANDGAMPHQEMTSAITKELQRNGLLDTPAGKKVLAVWDDALQGAEGKVSGAWKSRIAYDTEVERKFGAAIYDKGTDLADANRIVRQAANKVIAKNASRLGIDFSGNMTRFSRMYDIMENLSTQMRGPALKSGLGTALSHPVSRVVGAAVGGAGVVGLGKSLLP